MDFSISRSHDSFAGETAGGKHHFRFGAGFVTLEVKARVDWREVRLGGIFAVVVVVRGIDGMEVEEWGHTGNACCESTMLYALISAAA